MKVETIRQVAYAIPIVQTIFGAGETLKNGISAIKSITNFIFHSYKENKIKNDQARLTERFVSNINDANSRINKTNEELISLKEYFNKNKTNSESAYNTATLLENLKEQDKETLEGIEFWNQKKNLFDFETNKLEEIIAEKVRKRGNQETTVEVVTKQHQNDFAKLEVEKNEQQKRAKSTKEQAKAEAKAAGAAFLRAIPGVGTVEGISRLVGKVFKGIGKMIPTSV